MGTSAGLLVSTARVTIHAAGPEYSMLYASCTGSRRTERPEGEFTLLRPCGSLDVND